MMAAAVFAGCVATTCFSQNTDTWTAQCMPSVGRQEKPFLSQCKIEQHRLRTTDVPAFFSGLRSIGANYAVHEHT